MMKQDDLRLKFVALDTDGKPAKGRMVSVAVYSRQILTARRRLIGGFYAYDNQMKTTKLDASCSDTRSEEHTSELQSLMRISYAVFCLKKKNKKLLLKKQYITLQIIVM